jgi:endonuclease YncB( thermonuclease family)
MKAYSMKYMATRISLAFIYLFLASASALAEPGLRDYEGWVITILSGDTVRVLDGSNRMTKVRLRSIDAPQKGQAYGEESRKHLASLLSGKEVKVETKGKDGYGNVIGTLWVEPKDCSSCKKSLEVNLAQVRSGMAWWYREHAKSQSSSARGDYESAENKARERKLGLWVDAEPEPPWDWRMRTGEHEN